MLDRPDTTTLLKAMADTLSNDVLPTTSGPARHAVRVVANLCRILEREVAADSENAEITRRALVTLLDRDASLPELIEELDRVLCQQDPKADPSFDERARVVILADVERRLAINQPGYAS